MYSPLELQRVMQKWYSGRGEENKQQTINGYSMDAEDMRPGVK